MFSENKKQSVILRVCLHSLINSVYGVQFTYLYWFLNWLSRLTTNSLPFFLRFLKRGVLYYPVHTKGYRPMIRHKGIKLTSDAPIMYNVAGIIFLCAWSYISTTVALYIYWPNIDGLVHFTRYSFMNHDNSTRRINFPWMYVYLYIF